MMTKTVYDDPVVADIHAIRQALLDKCGGDIDEYRKRTRSHQAASARQIVTSPLKNRAEQSDVRERSTTSTPKSN